MNSPFITAHEVAPVRHPFCGLGAIAEAFAEASAQTGSCEELRQALESRLGEIDTPSAWLAMRRLVGLLALQTGQSPRSILDEEFTRAPSDDFWHAAMGGQT